MRLFESFSEIPEGFEKVWEVDMMKNKKFAVILNIAAILVIVIMVAAFVILNNVLEFSIEADMFFRLSLAIIGFMLAIILHELIHGIVFKLGTTEKLRFKVNLMYASASVPTAYFKKWHYFVAGLAPFVVIDSILVIMCIVFRDTSWLFAIYLVLALHTSGCVGDFYISYRLLRAKRDILINDTGTAMTFYGKNN